MLPFIKMRKMVEAFEVEDPLPFSTILRFQFDRSLLKNINDLDGSYRRSLIDALLFSIPTRILAYKIRTALRADPGSGVKYTYRLHSSNVETSVPRLSSVYFSKLQLEESIDTWNGT